MKPIFIAMLLLTAAPALAGNPAENIACAKDADCTVIQSVCPGDWATSNVTRLKQTKAFYASMATGMKCVRQQAGEKPSTACVNTRCILTHD